MAIRASNVQNNDQALCQAIGSGWRAFANCGNLFTFDSGQKALEGMQFFQPSALSRPGNAGTAYTGVWTGNIT
jgi:hypothetical protein